MPKTAIICGAGLGSRFKNLCKPKGFLNVGDRFLVEHSLMALYENGVERVIIGTGYASEYYEKLADAWPIELVHNPDYTTTGSLKTLVSAAVDVHEDVFVLDSDILYDAVAIDALQRDDRPNLVLVGSPEGQKDGAYVQAEGDRLLNISKDQDAFESVGVLVGIAKLSKEALQEIKLYAAGTDKKEHHDWSYFKIKSQFEVKVMSELTFTEIDDDEQLFHAVTRVYPKVRLV